MLNHHGTRILNTPRLLLRPFQMDDAKAFYENWASDPEVTKYLTWGPHESPSVTESLLKIWVEGADNPEIYKWGIVLKETDTLIGNISLVSFEEETASGDLGYVIGRRWWNQGLMSEAVRAVIAYLFEECGFEAVTACHDAENPASGRVMEKCGMRFTHSAVYSLPQKNRTARVLHYKIERGETYGADQPLQRNL